MTTSSFFFFSEILTIVLKLCVIDRFYEGILFGMKHAGVTARGYCILGEGGLCRSMYRCA